VSAGLTRTAATSPHPFWRAVRAVRRSLLRFSLPSFRLITWPIRLLVTAVQRTYHALMRVFVAEPHFKAHCRTVGRNVHTGPYVHWMQGRGTIEVGDDVLVDGKSSFTFTARYAAHPTLRIGSRCYIGHGCRFVVGREITIGNDVRLAAGVTLREASGHPLHPGRRAAGEAAPESSIRSIVIEDEAWLGADATILSGVRVGRGAVVATCAVVTRDVPAGTVVAGNPARVVREDLDNATD
jgi:acetyltransferase-like isoleucine patch superfamily enzyme